MKATRINAKQAQGLINNEEERFNDQPAIINDGDSKKLLFPTKVKQSKIDKDRNEIVEMFYSFLQDILYKKRIFE